MCPIYTVQESFSRGGIVKRPRLLAAALAFPLIGAVSGFAVPAASAQPALAGPATEFSVLAKDGQSIAAAQKAVRANLAHTKQAGDKRVKVGVIDTGVDGSHPDIAPNFDKADSRNFTKDIPNDVNGAVVDGPCEFRGCVDPVDHDDNGHG